MRCIQCCLVFTVTLANVDRFLLRDARSAKRSIVIVSRPSVRLSVCDVDVPWAYMLSKFEIKNTRIIISFGSSLLGDPTSAI